MSEPVNGASERSERSEAERCGASERSEQCERTNVAWERGSIERAMIHTREQMQLLDCSWTAAGLTNGKGILQCQKMQSHVHYQLWSPSLFLSSSNIFVCVRNANKKLTT